MANQIPLSGATEAAGGYILPEDQGTILAEGLLVESGALSLAGDRRATSRRREVFSIWKGRPTAQFVGEGGTKPVTGAEFGPGTLNIKKVATIVTFTDEMLEDVQSGDLNVLVESFPSLIVARLFGFGRAEYFQLEDAAERAAPQVRV